MIINNLYPSLLLGLVLYGGGNIQTCEGFISTTLPKPEQTFQIHNNRKTIFSSAIRSKNDGRNSLAILNQSVDNSNDHDNDALAAVSSVVNNDTGDALNEDQRKKNSSISAAFASLSLICALLFTNPLPSVAAATGGRMGGSFSRPRTSMSRPAPSTSSYSRSYSPGYRSYARPSVTVMPPAVVSPFYFSRPFYSYGAPGVITYSRGPSFIDFLFFGGILFAITNMMRSTSIAAPPRTDIFNDIDDSSTSFWGQKQIGSALGPGTSVVQISVAMNVPNRDDPNSILNVLNRLSNTARTDNRVGIQNLSSQIALEILRRKSSIVSAQSKYNHYNTQDRAQREFNQLSIRERSKFEQETVNKFGGVDYNRNRQQLISSNKDSTIDDKATMAVITMILSIDGDSTKVPKIASISDVTDALQKIASDVKVSNCLQSAEILWTPESRVDTLSIRDVIADYPELRSV